MSKFLKGQNRKMLNCQREHVQTKKHRPYAFMECLDSVALSSKVKWGFYNFPPRQKIRIIFAFNIAN